MDSKPKKLSFLGLVFVVIIVVASILFAMATNPFDQSIARILYSAVIGGLGGGLGTALAHKLGLSQP